uniref:Uncharacterized protein n=1 Tax=Cannabis sativa TaxID=3483 RepID=A0A803PEX8_CANSA
MEEALEESSLELFFRNLNLISRGIFADTINTVKALGGPKYDGKYLHNLISKNLSGVKLHQTLTNVVIPTFDINKLQPVIFSSYQDDTLKGDVASVDVATEENLNKLVEVGQNLLNKPASRLNVDTGLYEPIPNAGTNDQVLKSPPHLKFKFDSLVDAHEANRIIEANPNIMTPNSKQPGLISIKCGLGLGNFWIVGLGIRVTIKMEYRITPPVRSDFFFFSGYEALLAIVTIVYFV